MKCPKCKTTTLNEVEKKMGYCFWCGLQSVNRKQYKIARGSVLEPIIIIAAGIFITALVLWDLFTR